MYNQSVFRIYKSKVGKPRKDGSQLTESHGCNGKEHYAIFDAIWYNEKGQGVDGKSRVKPDKYLGKCTHKECRNLGGFILHKDIENFD